MLSRPKLEDNLGRQQRRSDSREVPWLTTRVDKILIAWLNLLHSNFVLLKPTLFLFLLNIHFKVTLNIISDMCTGDVYSEKTLLKKVAKTLLHLLYLPILVIVASWERAKRPQSNDLCSTRYRSHQKKNWIDFYHRYRCLLIWRSRNRYPKNYLLHTLSLSVAYTTTVYYNSYAAAIHFRLPW